MTHQVTGVKCRATSVAKNDDVDEDDHDDDDDDPKYDWHLALVSLGTRRLSRWLWNKPVQRMINALSYKFLMSLSLS